MKQLLTSLDLGGSCIRHVDLLGNCLAEINNNDEYLTFLNRSTLKTQLCNQGLLQEAIPTPKVAQGPTVMSKERTRSAKLASQDP